MKYRRKLQHIQAIQDRNVGRANQNSGRILPDLLPQAGSKIYAGQQAIYGPLGGAFAEETGARDIYNY